MKKADIAHEDRPIRDEPRERLVERLFKEHNESLIRFLRTRLRSDEEAREVAQEAYVRLLQLDRPEAVSYYRAFLFKTAANLAVDRLRRDLLDQRRGTLTFFEEGATTVKFGPWSGSGATPDFAIYETRTAEHRKVLLADGSTVALGGKSLISTAYTATGRLVILQEGAAYFDVARDTARPFIVQAGSRRISAVGTAFNTTRQVDRVVVTVTEGTIIVTPERKSQSTPTAANDLEESEYAGVARLEAGHQLAYSDHKVTPITIANPAMRLRGERVR